MEFVRHSSFVIPHLINAVSQGKLYLVATPIGNLEDISLRALRVLKEVDLIACEDTRHTAKLLTHYGLPTPRESFHEHNEAARTQRLLDLLRQGKNIALVSDAGTPLVSDPGYALVSLCRKDGIDVYPIPGPVAAVAALIGSGLPTNSFYFAGFLPSRSGARKKRLGELAGIDATLVLYEAPHRIVRSLEDITQALGPRPACLVRELTKIHEEWLRGELPEILRVLRARGEIKGEITLVVRGAERIKLSEPAHASIREHLQNEMREKGIPRKEALKSIARQRGISRREAYRLLLNPVV